MNQSSCDIAVIGAGAIGLSCAWKLAKRGLSVVVLDKSEAGHEASFAAGGMLAPSCESAVHPWNVADESRVAMFDFCCASRDLYPAFARELWNETGLDIELSLRGSPFTDWREPGILFVGSESELEHSLEWNGHPATLFAEDGQVDNRKLAATLRIAARQSGVEIRENVRVQSVLIENERAAGVSYEGHVLRAEKILLCAGAWSSEIHGVPDEITAAIRPLAGQIVQLGGERQISQIIYSTDCYLIPRRDGRLLVGATVEEVGFTKRITAGGAVKLLGTACALVPELADACIEAHWAGLRPASRDGLPLLGKTSLSNLFVATGHGRNGILLTPGTGEAVSAALCDGSEFPAAFSPARFASPA